MLQKDLEKKLEFARIRFQDGRLSEALQLLAGLEEIAESEQDWESLFEVLKLKVRIYIENTHFDMAQSSIASASKSVPLDRLNNSSRWKYLEGLAEAYQGCYSSAQKHFLDSRRLAEVTENIRDQVYADLGLLSMSITTKQFEKTQLQFKQLVSPIHELGDADIQSSYLMLKSLMFRGQGEFQRAIEVLDQVSALTHLRLSAYTISNLMFAYGACYFAWEKWGLAETHLKLAQKWTLGREFRHTESQIKILLDKLKTGDDLVDLAYDLKTKTLFEKAKGALSLRSQPILDRIFYFLLQKPGDPIKKSSFVEMVWEEAYDPSRHDNKLYVNILRARKLVEDDFREPTYILKDFGSYLLNPDKRYQLTSS